MSSFRRDTIWQHAAAINVFEIRENESLRCVSGAPLVKVAAGFDFTNLDVLSITNAVDRDLLLAWSWEIVSGAVSVYYRSYKSKAESSGLNQGVSLPFSDEKNDGTRYFLTHTNWRPLGNDWIEGSVTVDLQLPTERRVISFKEAASETTLI